MSRVAQPEPLRMTRQRRVILDVVMASHAHPTADEVFAAVRRTLPRISLATVYRNLELLAERGAIRRIDAAGGKRRYDGSTEHHDHVRCTGCGRVDDVHLEPVAVAERRVARATSFSITGYRLEFLGLCPSCRRASGARRKSQKGGRRSGAAL